ncbi:MAG: pyruvate kinase, partial [Dehalococcoidia bacterium]|nr:pyruvate kinase [Dehalococcoidia bacterium]
MARAAARDRDPFVLLQALIALRATVAEEGERLFARWAPRIQRTAFLPGARNLAAYLALRHHDLRAIQQRLPEWGLSSLGRSEGRVLANLDAVIATLSRVALVADSARAELAPYPPASALWLGERLLERQARLILGPPTPNRRVRIMVTLPTEAADSPTLISELIARGMNVARINCAHDDPDQWERMIARVREAEAMHQRRCKIVMDLSGPKARLGRVIGPPDDRLARVDDRVLLTRDAPVAT